VLLDVFFICFIPYDLLVVNQKKHALLFFFSSWSKKSSRFQVQVDVCRVA